MKRLSPLFLLAASMGCTFLPIPAAADSGHARIVRLSLVQGAISYTRSFHKDSLGDSKALWEAAPLNLPIREGFALSTDADARAEIEFENGAMAFLSGNTVLEFYDLSLDDGALITRLILRQGSAIFYVHPAKLDFFSVTGGDFSVEANGRARFRLDNCDDGSTVNVEQGQISVLRKNETKPLEKGQSYSINVNDAQNPAISRNADYDDFDKWVSGRVDSVVTATAYSEQYVNSTTYSSGFADLFTYGSWYNVPGYGFGWQPFGVGLGWNPFLSGTWGYDPFLGWNFIGSAPWGWLPYHYGGWVFNPGMGWVWVPTGFGPRGGPAPVIYRPVTAAWVHSGGVNGLVPLHPGDTPGKPPLNLAQGVYSVTGNTVVERPVAIAGQKWSVENHPPRELFTTSSVTPAPAPTRVSRTILSSNAGSRVVTLSRDSSIVYDAKQHSFVNSGNPPKTAIETEKTGALTTEANAAGKESAQSAKANSPKAPASSARPSAPRPNIAPPTPPASSHSASSHSSGGGAVWDGSSSSSAANPAGSAHGSPAGGSHASGGHH
jgi:FecR protein